MFKRILILLGTAILGFAACLASIRMSGSWSLLPNRDLDRSAGYFKDVLEKVNENYVDGKAAGIDNQCNQNLAGDPESFRA